MDIFLEHRDKLCEDKIQILLDYASEMKERIQTFIRGDAELNIGQTYLKIFELARDMFSEMPSMCSDEIQPQTHTMHVRLSIAEYNLDLLQSSIKDNEVDYMDIYHRLYTVLYALQSYKINRPKGRAPVGKVWCTQKGAWVFPRVREYDPNKVMKKIESDIVAAKNDIDWISGIDFD